MGLAAWQMIEEPWHHQHGCTYYALRGPRVGSDILQAGKDTAYGTGAIRSVDGTYMTS